MILPIDPVVISFGTLAVRWFGLLGLVGLGLAVWLGLREVRRQGLPRAPVLDALAWGLPAGLLCARVVYVLGWWDYYLIHASEVWQMSIDGLSLWGGLLGGLAIASARLGRTSESIAIRGKIADAAAPAIALGIAIGQLGAFLDGHGQGQPTDLPWATSYASSLAATPDLGVARHPAQLYDALIALALFVGLRRLPARLPEGSRLVAFVLLFGAARLALGPLRLEPAFFAGLQIEQLLALAGMLFAAGSVLWPLLTTKRPVPVRVRWPRGERGQEGEPAQAGSVEDRMPA